jgi:hypothetical protein
MKIIGALHQGNAIVFQSLIKQSACPVRDAIEELA